MAIASLVLGILWIWGLGSILALIFGLVGRKQIARSGGRQGGGGLAVAGIVLGSLGIAGAILITVGLAIAGNTIERSVNIQSACRSDYRTVEVAVESYRAQTGSYPSSTQALLSPVASSGGSTVGPWLTRLPVYPGHYQIEVDGSTVAVFTAGASPSQIGSSDTIADCFAVG